MTDQLDRALIALRREFATELASGLIVHLGTYNCRHKNHDPDQPWSEHAWPNAVDVMLKRIPGTATPTLEAKKVGYRVAAWMRAHPELWSEVYWQVMAHYDHVHGTASPRANYDNEQIPPCAGGPTEPPEEEMVSRRDKADEGIEALAPYMQKMRAMGAMTSSTDPGGVAFNDEVAKFILEHAEAFEAYLVQKYSLKGLAPGTVFTAQVTE